MDANSLSKQTRSSGVVRTTEAAHCDRQGDEEVTWKEEDKALKERRRGRKSDKLVMRLSTIARCNIATV